MGLIFKEPLLKNVQCEVAGQAVTLYEINGGDYWDHVLSADTFTNLSAGQNAEKQTPAEQYQILRNNHEKRLLLLACSLKPDHQDVDREQLQQELTETLNTEQQKYLYEQLEQLMGWQDPNVLPQDAASSTD